MCRAEADDGREPSPSSPSLGTPIAPGRPGTSAEARMALYTLKAMAGGGIHDQVGGGFHRYAVDTTWTVPHFEKMLYDNALLARAYLHGYRLSGDPVLLEVCEDTLDWALREMRGPEGGFYSALDADSDGVEGRFYVWTTTELEEVLGGDEPADSLPAGSLADVAIRWLGATEEGNFVDPHYPAPGLNVLEDRGPRPNPETRKHIRERLLEARAQRTRPGLDDKRLTSWNALMISALAEAGGAYLDEAVTCAEFVLRDLRTPEGRLLRTYSSGEAKLDAYLEDYAFLLEAFLALFEANCDERWLTEATALADELIERFADIENGGFFSTAADGEQLIARRKELEDSPIPAGGSSAAMGLLRLAQLTGEQRYKQHGASVIELLHPIAVKHPAAFGHLLQAMHWSVAPMRPIACALPPRN